MRPLWIVGIAVLVIGGLVLVVRHGSGTTGGFSNDDFGSLVALAALLIVIGGGVLADLRRPGGLAGGLKALVIWLAIGLGLVALYTVRDDLQAIASRMIGELDPARGSVSAAGDIVLTRANDGHFHIDGGAGTASIRFLVDTGATTTTLTLSDAARAGIDTGSLGFAVPVTTANGQVLMARAELARLTLGGVDIDGVRILVAPQGALDGSLLCNNVLRRFSRVAIDGDRLMLTP
ncbi:MAG: TIGR02281 family clan AA aspartic protease [Flavobacteriaceae bacterium]